ncbi:hypothetical protein [Kozakia baliensis]|nr:hypothetical protein [Kozakia baliensis]
MPRPVPQARWRLFFTREVLGVVVAMASVVVLVILGYNALIISGIWTQL